ncbi:type II toxin-antitoxin system toxin SpoIISA [Bacillus oleivorans]|uniref:Type II toxin-antitoxin system toxin SpoIISA n=1 Tax=Bacillus oleivorans TaxID=1448271 RepID=A0A285D6U4_9BACI|nr:type II toxin-antitoxin system SpoIISA family toxin [Bacillus oleivorans]SNX75530.1 type II toxin-antitoxin system toxin SpoIISA [Bacillus oleivorans]
MEGQDDKKLWKLIAPIILILIFFLIKEIWGSEILLFFQENKWMLLFGFITIILYISWLFPFFFIKHKQNLRRTWYCLFILGIVLIINDNGFDETQWQRYALLAGMFIFVDLALFLTPNIKRIAGTEIESINEMENINEEMKKAIIQTKSRSKQFTSILDSIATSPFGSQEWNEIEEYRVSLEAFLYSYGEMCRQDITVLRKENDLEFLSELGTSIGIELIEEQFNQLNEECIVQINNYIVLIPLTKLLHPVVIVIESQKDPVLQIDFDNIVNLSVIHSWYKKSAIQTENVVAQEQV